MESEPSFPQNYSLVAGKPKSKILVIAVVAVFLLILLGLGGFLYTGGNPNYYFKVQNSAAFLYSKNKNLDGRDTYYRDVFSPGAFQYSGAGYFPLVASQSETVFTSFETTWYIAGNFVRWEQINNSPDRYLVLESKASKNGNYEIPKVRVGFYKNAAPINKNAFTTGLSVEDLSSVIPKVKDTQKGVLIRYLGVLFSLKSEELDKIIKPGDVLAVRIYRDTDTKIDVVDINNVKVAEVIYIRRFDPENISKEIGRRVQFIY